MINGLRSLRAQQASDVHGIWELIAVANKVPLEYSFLPAAATKGPSTNHVLGTLSPGVSTQFDLVEMMTLKGITTLSYSGKFRFVRPLYMDMGLGYHHASITAQISIPLSF